MKALRPLTKGEREAARLAADRTKADAIAMIRKAATIWHDSGCASAGKALDHMADLIGEGLQTFNVVTEL